MVLIQSRRVAIAVIVGGCVFALVAIAALVVIFAGANWDWATLVTAAYLLLVSSAAIWFGTRSLLAGHHT